MLVTAVTTPSAAKEAHDVTTILPPPPPFDPELSGALAAFTENLPPLTLEVVHAMRSGGIFPMVSDDDLRRGGRFTVSERTVPGLGDDPDITLLICTPTAVTGTPGCVYHVHGGGMVLGNRRIGIEPVMDWADQFGLVVVSVEYRLAPETPHPGPIDDCYAGLLWTAAHAAELGFDPDRLLIAGGSAGGGLAAALALRARDEGGPALLGQMLLCPMLDDRNDTPSAIQMAGLGVWDRDANEFGWTALLGDARGGPDVSRTPRRPAPPTWRTCRPPSSTSAPRRRSATRTWPTRPGSGRPAARPNCTSGRAASTVSAASRRPPR